MKDTNPLECVYDESDCSYSQDDEGLELNNVMAGYPPLTEDQMLDALQWSKYRDGTKANLMLITGEGGSGKDVLSSMLAWKFGRYFPGCKRILDYRPRRPMGQYHFFNQSFMVQQVDRMATIANDECSNPASFQEKTKEWMSTGGEVFFKNSIQVYQEYKKYHYRRRPHQPMGLMLNDMYNIGRHMFTLTIGTTVKKAELDRFSCLPHVKYHCKMMPDDKNKHVYIATMCRVRWSAEEDDFIVLGKYRFPIYAAVPRPELGIKPEDHAIRRQTSDPKSDYYCWYDLYNSDSAIALGIPKSMRPKEQ